MGVKGDLIGPLCTIRSHGTEDGSTLQFIIFFEKPEPTEMRKEQTSLLF